MNNGSATPELVKAIHATRLREAERRRLVSRQNTHEPLSERHAIRMALGPGVQFGGVTEGILTAVTGRKLGSTTP